MSVPNGLAHVKSSKKITLKSISEKKKKTDQARQQLDNVQIPVRIPVEIFMLSLTAAPHASATSQCVKSQFLFCAAKRRSTADVKRHATSHGPLSEHESEVLPFAVSKT